MENNQLQHFLPTNEVMSVAKLFAESGMFTDAKQASQAFVKIMAGRELGIPPFAAMSGVHIIQGKPTIGAGLIASAIKGSGKYDYRVVEQSDKACSIDFYQSGDKIGNSSFTIEEARKAGTKNIDKFPKNMLFARAISNGVKWYCPDVFSGPVYTPEEMNSVEPDQVEDIPHVEVNPVIQDQSIIDSLEACTTPDEVKKIYASIPKSEKPIYKDLVIELGEKLKGAA